MNYYTRLMLIVGLILPTSALIPAAKAEKSMSYPPYVYGLLLGGATTLGITSVLMGVQPKTVAKVGLALASLYGLSRWASSYWADVTVGQKQSKKLALGKPSERLLAQEQPKRPYALFSAKNKITIAYSKKITQAQFNIDANVLAIVDGESVALYKQAQSGSWQLDDAKMISEPIQSIMFSKVGNRLLLTGKSVVKVCAVDTPDEWVVWENAPVSSARFFADGTKVLIISGTVATIVDVNTQTTLFEFTHKADITQAALTDNSDKLLTVSNNVAYVWNIDQKSSSGSTQPFNYPVVSAQWRPGGNEFVATGKDGTIGIFTYRKKIENFAPLQLPTNTGKIRFAKFSPLGTYMILLGNNRTIYLTESDRTKPALMISKDGFDQLFMSFDEQHVFVVIKNKLQLWNIAEKIEKLKDIASIQSGDYVQGSPDGSKILIQHHKTSKTGIPTYTTELWSH